MQRRTRSAIMIALAAPFALLAACGQEDVSEQLGRIATDAPPISKTPAARQRDVQAVSITDNTDDYEFSYGWPASVAAISPVAAYLQDDSDERLASLRQEAADWQSEGDQRGFDAPPQSFMKEWKVVTDLPRFLSLSADIYSYSGGAHGMSTFDALVWDRQEREAIRPEDMFVSAGSLDRAVQSRFCAELDRQRARKRGEPVTRGSGSFSDCIAPAANGTVILGSASGQAFDRIGFLVPPYNAGPYAEGEYEVTLPVDAALIDAVKPEYQRFFTPAG